MTKYLVLLGLLAAGCGPHAAAGDGPDLWIASKNDELHLQLVTIQPNPF